MAGLRERRQKETRADILRVSRDLFLEKGYEATTVEQIAEKAVVSAGTLYNYFPSKDEIFLSVLSDEIPLDAEKDDQDENGAGGYGTEDALLKFLNRYIKALKLFKKSLWRDVMSIVFAKSGSALFQKWFSFDMRFVASLEKRLQEFKRDGCLPASFDCGEAAFTIYSVLGTLFVLYVYTDDMTVDDFVAKIRKQVKFLISDKG
jgi:AcrR family transcriptional regulator